MKAQMNEQTLAELMASMEEKKAILALDNHEYDPVLRTGTPGWNIARAEAKEALDKLEAAYLQRLGGVCARVFCVGGTPKQIEKMRLAAEQQSLAINADILFQMIAEKCLPYTGNPTRFTTTCSMIMRDELAKAYLRYCPTSEFPRVAPETFDEALGEDSDTARRNLASIIKRAAKLTAAKPLAAMYAKDMALRLASSLRVAEEPVAIVVVGITSEDLPDFEAEFFPGRPSEIIDVEKAKSAEGALAAAGKRLEAKMAGSLT